VIRHGQRDVTLHGDRHFRVVRVTRTTVVLRAARPQAVQSLSVTAPTGSGTYTVGAGLTVSWTTNRAASGGEFGVWARSAAGSWYVAKLVRASGGSSFTTSLTLSVPAGGGYQAIVAYRASAGSGSWGVFGTSPGAFAVTAAAPLSLSVTAPTGSGTYAVGANLTVRWATSQAVSAGEFGVWARSAAGAWYAAKLLPASGAASYSTGLPLSVPAGSGYQAIVAYRASAGSGSWDSFGTSPGTLSVVAPTPTPTPSPTPTSKPTVTPTPTPTPTSKPTVTPTPTPTPTRTVTPTPTPTPTPTVTPTPTPTPTPTWPPAVDGPVVDGMLGLYVGTTTNSVWWAPALAKLPALGVRSIRVALQWWNIQPTATSYDWSSVDRVLSLAETYGLRVDLLLGWTPSWAQASDPDPRRGPDDPAALQAFAAALCTRYRGRIAALEIWNEPNATGFFQAYPGMSIPASYVRILKAAYAGAKGADPSVQIIAGNSDGRYSTDANGAYYAQDDFLSACYAAGAGGSFDMWATHNYPGSPGTVVPEFRFGAWAGYRSVWGVVESLRAILDAHGDGSKPLGITEVGWPNGGDSDSNTSAPPSFVTQRRYTVRNILHAYAHNLRTYQVMFVFDFPDGTYGIFNSDASERPVATAIRVVSTQLHGSVYQESLNAGEGNFVYRFRLPNGSQAFAAWTTAGEYVDESGVRSAADPAVRLQLGAGAVYAIVNLDGTTAGQYSSGAVLNLTNDPVLLVPAG
jgi:hypothetical protein